jgi:hypothetical protein
MAPVKGLLYVVALRVSIRFVIDVHELLDAVFDHFDECVAGSFFELGLLEPVEVLVVGLYLIVGADLDLQK